MSTIGIILIIITIIAISYIQQAAGITLFVAPLVAGAAIAGAASLIGQGGDMYFQGKSNQATRDWNQRMYENQRRDQWSDWNAITKYNEQYNSPAAQKQRLIDAGLNPALMYGNGSVANTNQASMPGKADPGHYKEESITGGNLGATLGNALGGYADASIKDAQLRQINQSIANMQVDNALKIIQADTKSLELGLKRDTYDTTVQKAREQLENIIEDTNNKIVKTSIGASDLRVKTDTEDNRIKASELQNTLTNAKINLTREQIENLAQRTANLSQEGTLIQAKGEELMSRMNLQSYQVQKIRQEIDKLLYENDTKGAKDVIDRLMKLIPKK